jgi:hypothetical protein
MPYTSEKIILPRELDRRVKLTEIDKEDIKHRHKAGEPIHAIARAYKGVCSRRMIQFVIFPERLKALQEKHIAEKSHLKYYNKDKWRETMKEHRHYKQDLKLKGIIK